MADLNFSFTIEDFNQGLSPLAHADSLTFNGAKGQASEMLADIISKPGFLTQSPALSNLTNGTQAGVVDQLIRFILDKPISASLTYALGTSKLFRVTPTTISSGGSPSFPQTVTNMTSGESLVRLNANLYGFFNKASGGDIFKMPLSTEVIDHTWGSVNDTALENAPHPVCVKEDIMLFGNGQYVGLYIEGTGTLNVQHLDFGVGSEVADIVFTSNNFWIAVNSGEGKRGQVYLYDAGAQSNQLSDEAGLGDQQIGFLYVYNGNVYVAYEDTSSDAYVIGYVAGKAIKPLRYFSGTLPDHRQKALYRDTIIFSNGTNVMSMGASVEQLPLQISALADGGYATIGAIACPFGTPMVASTDGGSNYRIAKFSGYATDSVWKSKLYDITNGRMIGKIQNIIVYSKRLAANARCDISIETDQALAESSQYEYSGTGTTRKTFRAINAPAAEDYRLVISWENGNATNDCPIRKVIVQGNYVER